MRHLATMQLFCPLNLTLQSVPHHQNVGSFQHSSHGCTCPSKAGISDPKNTNNYIIQEKYGHPTRNGGVPTYFCESKIGPLQNLISQSIWQKLEHGFYSYPCTRASCKDGFSLQNGLSQSSDSSHQRRKWYRIPHSTGMVENGEPSKIDHHLKIT